MKCTKHHEIQLITRKLKRLGHGGNTTTDIYIDFDERKKDIAMRRVIDYVNGSQP